MVTNPAYEDRLKSDYDIVVAGTENRMNMIETGANIIPEADIVAGIGHGFQELQQLLAFQKEIAADIHPTKRVVRIPSRDEALIGQVQDFAHAGLDAVLYTKNKQEYINGMARLQEELETL